MMDDYHTVINMQTTTPSQAKPVFFALDYRQKIPFDDEGETPPPSEYVLEPIDHEVDKNWNLLKGLYRLAKSSDDLSLTATDKRQIEDLMLLQRPKKNTILHIPASFASHKVVNHIIETDPFLVFLENSDGDNPLHVAIRAGHFGVLKLVFHGYFEVCSSPREVFSTIKEFLGKRNKQGNTILHEALIHKQAQEEQIIGFFDKIEIPGPEMSRQKLSVSVFEVASQVTNKDGKSALYLAIEMGYFGFVTKIRYLGENHPFLRQS